MLLEQHAHELWTVITSDKTTFRISFHNTSIGPHFLLIITKSLHLTRLIWSTTSTLRLSFITSNQFDFRFGFVLPSNFCIGTISIILIVFKETVFTGVVDYTGVKILVGMKVLIVEKFELLLLGCHFIQFLFKIQNFFFLLSIFWHHFLLLINHFL